MSSCFGRSDRSALRRDGSRISAGARRSSTPAEATHLRPIRDPTVGCPRERAAYETRIDKDREASSMRFALRTRYSYRLMVGDLRCRVFSPFETVPFDPERACTFGLAPGASHECAEKSRQSTGLSRSAKIPPLVLGIGVNAPADPVPGCYPSPGSAHSGGAHTSGVPRYPL